jgi:hypothetical protein
MVLVRAAPAAAAAVVDFKKFRRLGWFCIV